MLNAIAEDLWCAEADLKMPGKIFFRCRMTLVRLENQALLLYSPIEITAELSQAIDALGTVRWIVAPNGFHHLYLRSAMVAWPEAEVWASPILPTKRRNLSFTGVLDGKIAAPWGDQLSYLNIKGAPKMSEIVLFHKPSKTLIVTDLIFHIHQCKNLRTRLLFKIVGSYRKVAQSRVWRLIVKDRQAASQSAAEVFGWNFQRVVMAHGEVLEVDARMQMAHALRWMLKRIPIPQAKLQV